MKKKEKFKYSLNESQRVNLDQKKELQKYNETITQFTLSKRQYIYASEIEACGETENVHKIQLLK